VGADLERELANWYSTSIFGWGEMPRREVVLVVKHPLAPEIWAEIPTSPRIIYCPIDHFGSALEIDDASRWLRRCSRILVHCERLRRYFAPYAPVEYLDHHVKFVGEPQAFRASEGPILWVGVRSNLPPLVEWVNQRALRRELVVLTNPEDPSRLPAPDEYGFSGRNRIRIECWSPERHLAWLPKAAGALDIKGTDFRSRHKPPAKAIDYLAAGVPLAMNADSSSAEHLATLGFDVAAPEDEERWFSQEYWDETRRFGGALRELLTKKRVAFRLRRVIEAVLQERTSRGTGTSAPSFSLQES
jgi:hypothetical protein